MEYCCHIWTGDDKSSLSNLDRVRDRLMSYYFPPYSSFLTDETSTLYQLYFYSKCSDYLHSFVLRVQTFTVKTRHSIYTEANHSHFLCAVVKVEVPFGQLRDPPRYGPGS